MSHKAFRSFLVSLLILLSLLIIPEGVHAGGACTSPYVVQWGDTLTGIAQRCGVTVEAILAANPSISPYLYAGQTLVLPLPLSASGSTYAAYVVQSGDTFGVIAGRFGLSISALAVANPHIRDINVLYPGQVIYVPASAPINVVIVPTPTAYVPVPLSYGAIPRGVPTGSVHLWNKSKGSVYVSLQGTSQDGTQIIREHPVGKVVNVQVPAGWYIYVAWVGNQKFTGQFKVTGDRDYTLTFYENKVILE